jgi:hypothetical protein
MVYQENGASFDLTTNSIGSENPELIYRVFYIQKSEKGVEEAYGTGTTAGSFIPGIRYMITSLGDTTQAEWNTAVGTSNVIYEVGDSFKAVGVGTTVDATPAGTATSGGVDAIQFTDEAGTFRELGEFRFQISASLVNSIFDASGAYSYSTLKAANTSVTSEHVGIAWTASHRNYVKAADLKAGDGGWTNISVDSATYIFKVENQKYLSIGRTVRVDDFGDWRNRSNTGNVIQYSGKIVTIDDGFIGVEFKGTDIGLPSLSDPATNLIVGTGSKGTLNIVDEFILAKGRII